MTLCQTCQDKSDRWSDYRSPPAVKISSGASRDDTTAGVADARRARYEEWRRLIQQQQAAIKRICERDHQAVKP